MTEKWKILHKNYNDKNKEWRSRKRTILKARRNNNTETEDDLSYNKEVQKMKEKDEKKEIG